MGSLLTAIREFKTIKNCEFFKTGPIIFNPKQGLEDLHEEESKNVQFDSDQQRMTKFIEQNADQFNTSQLEALDRVAAMKEKDILLI